MSDVRRLKEQLHQISMDAKQAGGGLAQFKVRFSQQSAQVQALIAGTASGVDRDIAEILDAAGRAVEQASQSLEIAAASCARYADQI
ncbi:hypothetical protein PWY87_13395 [Kribbella solani]|uniref:hypothetical protein n=1 Tax=Kribbella solani TaxID=236067 RepID=UPI0029AC847F|nr:hypothetical protein [Kribbella solani]MDX3002675.1 hypothetical protein [Kribbella solani]